MNKFRNKYSNIKAGDLLLSEQPFAFVLTAKEKRKRCDNCLELGRLLKCLGCQCVYYCGRECQRDAWIDHQWECAILERIAPKMLPDNARLLARIINRLARGDGHYQRAYYSATKFRMWKDLMSHYSDLKADKKRMEHFLSLSIILHKYLRDISLPNTDELMEIYGKMIINSFKILDTDMNSIGTGVYLASSIVDHSCKPNAVATFHGNTISLRALEDMSCLDWDQIRVSYIDLMYTPYERQTELLQKYYFLCQCEKCLDETQINTVHAAKCMNMKCRYTVNIPWKGDPLVRRVGSENKSVDREQNATVNAAQNGTVNAAQNATVNDAQNDTVNAVQNGTVNAAQNATVNAAQNDTVNAAHNGTVNAAQNATVNAAQNDTVNAAHNGTVNAAQNATVNAAQNDTVNAAQNGTVNAAQNGTVNAAQNATVNAAQNDTVNAAHNGTVNAAQNATVNAAQNDTVNAAQNGTVNAAQNGTVNAAQNGPVDSEADDIIRCGKCGTKCTEKYVEDFVRAMNLTEEYLKVMKDSSALYVDTCQYILPKQRTLHPLNVLRAQTLKDAFGQMGLWERVTELANMLLPCFRFYYGDRHPLLGIFHLKYGKILLYQMDVRGALEEFQSAQKILMITHGTNHPLYRKKLMILMRHAFLESRHFHNFE